jgi:type II secretory pathway predicted ATPase ExeA
MYQSYWGLKFAPFSNGAHAENLYYNDAFREALARLRYLVELRRRLGLLTGPAGSGKSLLLGLFAGQLAREGKQLATASLAAVQPGELLCMLAAQFGLNLDPSASMALLWRKLTDRLLEYAYQQLQVVVLLDDADEVSVPTTFQISRLAQLDLSPQLNLTMVLAGREDRIGAVGQRLLQLVDLRIDLPAWEENDSAQFIRRSLQAAGCASPVFDNRAIARLHELSQGNPRRLAKLADLALLAGAGQKTRHIDEQLVEAVHQELHLCPADAAAELSSNGRW